MGREGGGSWGKGIWVGVTSYPQALADPASAEWDIPEEDWGPSARGQRALCTSPPTLPSHPSVLALPPFLDSAPPDLKRFSEARIRTSKLTTFISFQLKDLDLREFAAQSCSECPGARRGLGALAQGDDGAGLGQRPSRHPTGRQGHVTEHPCR